MPSKSFVHPYPRAPTLFFGTAWEPGLENHTDTTILSTHVKQGRRFRRLVMSKGSVRILLAIGLGSTASGRHERQCSLTLGTKTLSDASGSSFPCEPRGAHHPAGLLVVSRSTRSRRTHGIAGWGNLARYSFLLVDMLNIRMFGHHEIIHGRNLFIAWASAPVDEHWLP